MSILRDFIQFIKDALWITKLCFTSFWFWLPVIFGAYIPFQMWLMLAVHPLTVAIVPAFLAVYMIIAEDKRLAAQYGLKKKTTSTPGAVTWNVRKSVEEYLQILSKRQPIRDQPPIIEQEEEQE